MKPVVVNVDAIQAAKTLRETMKPEAKDLLEDSFLSALTERSSTLTSIELFLAKGVDADIRWEPNRRPATTLNSLALEISCFCREDVIRLLLANGAKVISAAVAEAILKHRSDIVNLLLNHDQSFGKTLSRSFYPICAAIYLDSTRMMRRLFERLESSIARLKVLAISIYMGAVDVTNYIRTQFRFSEAELSERTSRIFCETDNCENCVPLTCACVFGQVDLVEDLLKQTSDRPRQCPGLLGAAILTDDERMISAVIPYINPEEKDYALGQAIAMGRTQSCRTLLQNGFNLDKDKSDNFARHWPPRIPCLEILQEGERLPEHESSCPCLCKVGCEPGGKNFKPPTTGFVRLLSDWGLPQSLRASDDTFAAKMAKTRAGASEKNVNNSTGSLSKGAQQKDSGPASDMKQKGTLNQRAQPTQTTPIHHPAVKEQPKANIPIRPPPQAGRATYLGSRLSPARASTQGPRSNIFPGVPQPTRWPNSGSQLLQVWLNSSTNGHQSSSIRSNSLLTDGSNSTTDIWADFRRQQQDDYDTWNNFNNNNNNYDNDYYNNNNYNTYTTYDTYDPNVGYCHW